MKNLLIMAAFAVTSFFISCGHPQKCDLSSKDSAILVQMYLKAHFKEVSSPDKGDSPFAEYVLPDFKNYISSSYFLDALDTPSILNNSLSVDTGFANTMIKNHIDDPARDPSSTLSFRFNADTIKKYIYYADSVQTPIKYFRFMFATYTHNPPGGTQRKIRTLVVAGLDASNNYVLYKNNSVFEHCLPCPDQCPKIGPADISNYIRK